jgi:hypothetical protein
LTRHSAAGSRVRSAPATCLSRPQIRKSPETSIRSDGLCRIAVLQESQPRLPGMSARHRVGATPDGRHAPVVMSRSLRRRRRWDEVEHHGSCAGADHSDRLRRAARQVDHALAEIGAAIIDAHDHGFSVLRLVARTLCRRAGCGGRRSARSASTSRPAPRQVQLRPVAAV